MNRYMIHCTKEQTKKALELGAPIEQYSEDDVPTAEQMIGWLEVKFFNEVYIEQDVDGFWSYTVYLNNDQDLFGLSNLYSSRREATLAAIDAALDYLSKKQCN